MEEHKMNGIKLDEKDCLRRMITCTSWMGR